MLGDDIGAFITGNLDGPATIDLRRKRPCTMEKGQLVLLEKIKDSIVILLDDLIFATQQRIKVEFNVFDLDAMLTKTGVHLVVMLGRLQQRFGRYATYVGTCSTGCRLPVSR